MVLEKNIFPYVRQLTGGKVSQKIFFLHIHKCGGTSVVEAVMNSFGLAEKISRRHFFTLNNDASVTASKITGEDLRNYREKLLIYHLSMERMKYVSGHFFYSEKAMQTFSKEWNFITLLRHPVSRWFSHYFFDRYREGSSHGRIYTDLESFVNSEKALVWGSNYVTTYTENISLSEAYSDEAISRAIENLKKFALVGMLERIDVFAKDYKNLFGVELSIPRFNTNPLLKQQQKELISDEIQQKVEEICQPNVRVYKAMWEQTR